MISTATNSTTYVANGATTAFATGFRFLANADLVVTVAGVTKTLGVDYTVTGATVDAGGTVTFGVAPANTLSVVIKRTVTIAQPYAFRDQGHFAAQTHEDALDNLCFIDQQLERRLAAAEVTVTALLAQLAALGY